MKPADALTSGVVLVVVGAALELDGYMSDLSERDGNFEWSVPTAEVCSAMLELERAVGTYLYGRRMYETMAVWETAHVDAGAPAFTPGLLELGPSWSRASAP